MPKGRKELPMFFGQTSNWLKQVREISKDGKVSVPHIASQYVGGENAIRVHCGAETQVQVKLEFYMTSDDDLAQLDQFLNHFGLPRNGFQVVDTRTAYQPSAHYTPYGASSTYETGAGLPMPLS